MPGVAVEKDHKTSTKQAPTIHTTEPSFVVKHETGTQNKVCKLRCPIGVVVFDTDGLIMIIAGVAAPGLKTLIERRAPESRLLIGMTPIGGRLRDD